MNNKAIIQLLDERLANLEKALVVNNRRTIAIRMWALFPLPVVIGAVQLPFVTPIPDYGIVALIVFAIGLTVAIIVMGEGNHNIPTEIANLEKLKLFLQIMGEKEISEDKMFEAIVGNSSYARYSKSLDADATGIPENLNENRSS